MATATTKLPNSSIEPETQLKFTIDEYSGPSLKRGTGRVRQPNPFDEIVERAAKSGETYQIKFDTTDETTAKAAAKTLRNAVGHLRPRKGVDMWIIEPDRVERNGAGELVPVEPGIVFVLREPRERKSTAAK